MLPDLETAINDYLEAYTQHQKFLKASENLFKVFATSWRGSPRHCAEAYSTFTQSLRKDWTYKHLDVSEVYPSRSRASE
jgi:hypothetical protein